MGYHSGLDVVPASRAEQLAAEPSMPEAVTVAMDDLAGAASSLRKRLPRHSP